MKFYLNEISLLQSRPEHLDGVIVEVEEFFRFVQNNDSEMYVKQSLFYDPLINNLYAQSYKYYPLFMLLSKVGLIQDSPDRPEIKLATLPDISDSKALELFQYCVRDNQKVIISSATDNVLVQSAYEVDCDLLSNFTVQNIIGTTQLDDFFKYNPPCTSTEDVFARVEELCLHIKFTGKAYSTAAGYEYHYKNYSYHKILQLFIAVEELLYPYFAQKISSYEKEMIKIFSEKTGVEFSQESAETLKLYGKARQAVINGETHLFTYHLKPADIRIYIKYISSEDTIYVGHAAEHLKTHTRRK